MTGVGTMFASRDDGLMSRGRVRVEGGEGDRGKKCGTAIVKVDM
jgi:hypothetical protein